MKRKAILCDCKAEEIYDFRDGLQSVTGGNYSIESTVSNWGRSSKILNIKRYATYFMTPWKAFLRRNKYEVIIGWQQFYALIFCWFELVFHVKKECMVAAVNFTYKKKRGIIGKIYYSFMKSICSSKYLDYIHVPSENYKDICCEEIGIDAKKVIVAPFGIPDSFNTYKNTPCDFSDFALAIGRSNRDYEFLVDEWKSGGQERLVIISDTWKPTRKLPQNIVWLNNVSGEGQYKYISNCRYVIIPIEDGAICSGDTVLLKAMSFEKTVFVSKPSMISEMYIVDGDNGLLYEKNKGDLVKVINENQSVLTEIGKRARLSYLEKFSRVALGNRIGQTISTK